MEPHVAVAMFHLSVAVGGFTSTATLMVGHRVALSVTHIMNVVHVAVLCWRAMGGWSTVVVGLRMIGGACGLGSRGRE